MTDRNYLGMPAQEKLEWVTPKISLMDAGGTRGTKQADPNESINTPYTPNNLGNS